LSIYNIGGQFHQLLAAYPDKDAASKKIFAELVKTMTKSDMFDGFVRKYTPFEEGGEKQPEESKEMVTTVDEKLHFALPIIAKAIDAALSKEASNASGKLKAELTVDGKSYGTFDAQALLQLEKQLRDLRVVADHLPTLDMAKSWTPDGATREGTFATGEAVTYRYVEETIPVVLYEATKEHAAQVKETSKRTQVGEFVTKTTSGRITPAQKAKIQKKLDNFLVAINKARSVANTNEATNVNVANMLLSDIFDVKL